MPSIYTYISEKSWKLIFRMPIFERLGKLNCDHLSNSTFSLASLRPMQQLNLTIFMEKNLASVSMSSGRLELFLKTALRFDLNARETSEKKGVRWILSWRWLIFFEEERFFIGIFKYEIISFNLVFGNRFFLSPKC